MPVDFGPGPLAESRSSGASGAAKRASSRRPGPAARACGGGRRPGTESKRQGESMKIALLLKRIGLTSTLLHSMGAASIAASVSLWGRSAAVSDRHAKARAEPAAVFVGLWPPTFLFLGKVLRTSRRRQKSRLSRPAFAPQPSRSEPRYRKRGRWRAERRGACSASGPARGSQVTGSVVSGPNRPAPAMGRR